MALVGWLLVTFAAAAVGAIASVDSAEFYLSLDRPAWAPAPGQAAVLYDGEAVIGGGRIASPG